MVCRQHGCLSAAQACLKVTPSLRLAQPDATGPSVSVDSRARNRRARPPPFARRQLAWQRKFEHRQRRSSVADENERIKRATRCGALLLLTHRGRHGRDGRRELSFRQPWLRETVARQCRHLLGVEWFCRGGDVEQKGMFLCDWVLHDSTAGSAGRPARMAVHRGEGRTGRGLRVQRRLHTSVSGRRRRHSAASIAVIV